jgi:hypothetical protein
VEYFAYLLKTYIPWIFAIISRLGRLVTEIRYRRAVASVYGIAGLTGTIKGKVADIRPLEASDIPAMLNFVTDLPVNHLKFFHPHNFDAKSLRKVFKSPAFLTYGLFVEGELKAYALLKLTPFGSAFIGRLVSPELNGLGIGRFLARYLYWQAHEVGVIPHSTISKSNLASLRSHEAVGDFIVVKELPNDFLLIQFTSKTDAPPSLEI